MMQLQRYFLKQFIQYFVVLTVGLSLFFSAIHLIDNLDSLMPYEPLISDFALYFLLVSPNYFLYLLPMSTLLCTIMTFAIATKRKEIVAFKAAGGDIRALLAPFIVAGIVIVIIDMGLSEFAVPTCNRKTNDLMFKLRENKQRLHLKQGNIWVRGKGNIILHADTYIPSEEVLRKVVIFGLQENRPSYKLFAHRAIWENGKWTLENIRKYDFVKRQVVDLQKLRIGGFTAPDVFLKGITTPEEMGIAELLDYRKRLEDSGYKNTKLDVDIVSKITYPFTCLFMMLMGFSLSLRRAIRSGIVGVAIGVIISLIYWFFYTFMLSLGYAGVMSPLIAASAVPLLFTFISIIMVRQTPR